MGLGRVGLALPKVRRKMTPAQLLARLEEVDREIAVCEGFQYAIDEGFCTVTQDEDGEFSVWPVDEAHYITIPE